ncbi:general secretion pathway protein GspB [Thermochromatium tepidum]|uniref:Type II secretion system protein GspB C-terminal domain-containing protein n=1 Tax=Thermochromatium tepidum ATCC 43061 TaxID=316276 RepID=A0A6I6EDB8_THETI|nr:general secretion pathway protein GspB [Thermochromatium tepidum]QGU32090.1 hypothetical protein E6P07_03255 [Thermochromatium tepidum ATCC 43061]
MSYILEALKKSQQERGLGQVPTLDASGLFVEDREPQVTHHWALLAIGLAVLAVVIALYAAFRGARPVPVPMTILDASRVEPALLPQSTPTPPQVPLVEPPPPKPAPSRPSAPESESAPVVRVEPPSQTAAPDVDPEWEMNLLRQLEAEQAAMKAAREVLEEPPRVAPVPDDLIQDIESFKQQVRREQGVAPTSRRAPVETQDDPRRLKLTPQQQAAVPAYLMTVHVYDPDVTKRFVVINSLRYHEGEETREGLRVERILQDGAVLSYLGNPFFVSR